MSKDKNKKRGSVTIIIFNIVILLVIIAGAEFASSFFTKKTGLGTHDDYQLHHAWLPSSSFLHDEWIEKNPDFPEPYEHHYNKQAWIENYDVKLAKEAGSYRIFYLGDSFTEGTVAMEGSVPSLVEKGLNELSASSGKGLKFEVINTGTSSYSPTIFYVLLRQKLLDYSPDLIVVNVDLTDDFDDWKYSKTTLYDKDGNPWAVPPGNVMKGLFVDTESGAIEITTGIKAQLFLLKHSYAYNLIQNYFGPEKKAMPISKREQAIKNASLYKRWMWCFEERDAMTQTNVDRTLDMISRIARLAVEHNVKIVFTNVPHFMQYAGKREGGGEPNCSNRAHYEIKEAALDGGALYLNSYEALKPLVLNTPQEKYYYNYDMHFNPRGYRIWANAHLDFLTDKSNALLPDGFYEDNGR